MTTFDEREKGFEGQFAHEQELEFKARVRCARMIGTWAAERLGLEGEQREAYAQAVAKPEAGPPVPEDVLRKVVADFQAAHVDLNEPAVLQKMQELLAVARVQVQTGG